MHEAKRYVAYTRDTYLLGLYEKIENPLTHFKMTGPEIWRLKPDILVAGDMRRVMCRGAEGRLVCLLMSAVPERGGGKWNRDPGEGQEGNLFTFCSDLLQIFDCETALKRFLISGMLEIRFNLNLASFCVGFLETVFSSSKHLHDGCCCNDHNMFRQSLLRHL